MDNKFKIVLFAYNFPHRKTVDFINKIYAVGFSISLILAANFVKINKPKSAFNYKAFKSISPEELAETHKIPYYVVKHNSLKAQNLLKQYEINFGIISGSRILSKEIISLVRCGILNFHPGILPMIRGLDSILWSIYKEQAIGVTVHLINEYIDSGLLVQKKTIIIDKNDNLQSLFEKNYQLQLDLIPISLNLIFNDINCYNQFDKLEKKFNYNSYMPYGLQLGLKPKIISYIKKFS
ncbi:MAG: hypothetical protein CMD27_00425 [Flavobacteriales bacterium]|nr:hypothetical protein [Flavobacteriales bacterium]